MGLLRWLHLYVIWTEHPKLAEPLAPITQQAQQLNLQTHTHSCLVHAALLLLLLLTSMPPSFSQMSTSGLSKAWPWMSARLCTVTSPSAGTWLMTCRRGSRHSNTDNAKQQPRFHARLCTVTSPRPGTWLMTCRMGQQAQQHTNTAEEKCLKGATLCLKRRPGP